MQWVSCALLMNSHVKSSRRFALAIFAVGAVLISVQSAFAAEASAASAAARGKAGKAPASAADLQKMVDQVNSQREKMIADHDALAKQLKDATDEQRKIIMDRLREQKKDFEAAQSALHKQIRDDQRRQRQNMAPGNR